MNIKSILLISILIAVMVFNSGCIDEVTETLFGGDSDSADKDTRKPSKETLAIDAFLSNLSNLDVDFDTGTFSASDTDNDGKDDIYRYTFEEEDVAEGLSLERKVEYENTDEGLMGSLTLDFENTWGDDDTKSYTHTETIPKSFAGNVDDLKFSVEPDRIVNPDPELEWIIKGMVDDITVEAKNEAVSAATGEVLNQLGWWGTGILATKINITALENVISSGGTATERIDKLHEMIEGAGLTPTESAALDKAAETGVSVAVGTVLEHFDDFKAIQGLAKCNRMYISREADMYCLMAVIAKYPNSFTKADCERLNFDDAPHLMSSSFASNAACKSVVSGDINDCIQLFIGGLELSREMKEKQCRMQVFNFYATRCRNIQDPQTKKDCLFLSAIESGSADACKSKYAKLSERQRKICLAMNTQNISYCRGMKDEKDWKTCCELLDPDLKEDCLKKEECDSEHLNLCDNEKECGDACGYWYNSQCNKEEGEKEDEKSEDGAADEFRQLSDSICPTPVPNEAKYWEYSTPGYPEVMQYWVMPPDDTYVGLFIRWADQEKTKKKSQECWGNEGKEGVNRHWHKDGVTISSECYMEDNKLHGVCKRWYEDGTLKFEGNYQKGKTQGVCKGWNEDGTLKFECNYQDGKCQECVPDYCYTDPC